MRRTGWRDWIVAAVALALALALTLALALSPRSRDGAAQSPGQGNDPNEGARTLAREAVRARTHAPDERQADAALRPSSVHPVDDVVAGRPARVPAVSLDEAEWNVVERRITAAIAHARDRKGVRVSPSLVDRLRESGEVDITVELASGYHSIDSSLSGTRHASPFHLAHVPFTQVRVGPQALENLLVSARTGSVSVSFAARPTLAETIPLIDADVAQAADATGEGFTVVIVDSGVETSHPFFAGRIVDGHCYSTGALCPGGGTIETDSIAAGDACSSAGDDCGHGTGVAGAAVGSDGSRVGVAPEATLISIMAASPIDERDIGLGFISTDLVRALDKVYSQRNDFAIAAVNLSLSTDPVRVDTCQDLDPSFTALVSLLGDAEIAVVAASGNDGFGTEGKQEIGWPACVDGVVSVGATTKGDEVAAFSNSSSRLDLLAPGVGITTSALGGGYAAVNGTSVAAPHVSGAFAAIRSVYPDEQADRILLALDVSGRPIDDDANGVTTSRINVAAAILLIEDGDLRWDYEKVYDEVFAGPSRCGLIGLEPLIALAALRWARRRRRSS